MATTDRATEPTYTVGEVARLARVSARTLHHYHEIGLLEPSARSEAGYRLYDDTDLAQLQQILFYKALGFALDEIRGLVQKADPNRRTALLAQRALVEREVRRLEAMLELLDKTLASLEGRYAMSKEEMFDVFGEFDPSEYEAEAKERWGDTDAYQVSAKRTKGYTKADWQRFKAESDALNADLARLMDEGVPPDDPRALEVVERARLQIDRWFYPCSREMHAKLGEMYVADARFTATYEAIRPGMARYLRDATAANAARGEP